MKKRKLKIALMCLTIFSLTFVSCSDNDAPIEDVEQPVIDLKSAQEEAEVELVTSATSDIVEEAFLTQEFPETKSTVTDRYLPDCVTITVVITDNIKTVTIDFGDGCELRNGNILSGKIILSYEKDREAATKMMSFMYENFYFNRKQIEGEGSILRERSNENGNPQSTKTFNVTVTWPDGTFASKEGMKVREMIEGQNTHAWGDNVFSITGYWKFTRKNGGLFTATITEALRRELACKFLVSGVVELTRTDIVGVLDYGDGDCDDLATISINGGPEREIHLSNF